jgi:FemAB-related protein (PEP-CTERM system-associated)
MKIFDMLTIKQFNDSYNYDWDEYALNHPDGTVFHTIAWKRVIEQSFMHKCKYLLALENDCSKKSESSVLRSESKEKLNGKIGPEGITALKGISNRKERSEIGEGCSRIVGILPIFQVKNPFFGNFYSSVPFGEIGGILADDEKIAKRLLSFAIKETEKDGCDYMELRNRAPISDLPSKHLYFNFRRQIYPTADQNYKAIPRKARRMIRVGEKHGLFSEVGNHLVNEFYQILAKNYHRLGTPIFPMKFFKNFIKIFKDDVEILLIRTKDDVPIASVMTFFYKDQVLPYYAGSLFEYRKLAPNDFMYWELMHHGCKNGYKFFNFGRSKLDTGPFHFKRHWGFEPEPLAYQYHLVKLKQLPDISPSNPKYQRKIKIWKLLPLPVTKILGPPISKYLA